MQQEPTVLTINKVSFTERQLRLIAHAKNYQALGMFGLPNHLWYTTLLNLAKLAETSHYSFKSDYWESED